MKTDLQKFEDLLNELGVKYQINTHAMGVKELGIYPDHLYRNYKDEVNNSVSIVFDKDNKFIYFEGMNWR